MRLNARRVRRARRLIAREGCASKLRHRWEPLPGLWGALFVRCHRCGVIE